jgi:FixJ family two-component response regulator
MDSRKSGSSSTIEIKGRFVTTSVFQAASLQRGQNAWRLTNLYSVHEDSGRSNVCAHKHRLTLSDIGLERAVQTDKFLVERPILRGEGPPLLQGIGMCETNPCVFIVDDDPVFRDSVGQLLRSVGLESHQFSSVSEFLKADLPKGPTCLVLDVRMPGGSGLELQRELSAANRQLPIIFITAHGDIPMSVQAIKAGAVEFLTKPFRDQDLLDAIETGLARDRARRESDKALSAVKERFETLSSREREILIQVTAGRLNKQIAGNMGIAESTVKVHRTNLMRKMKARSLPELSRMVDALKLTTEKT